MRPWRPKIRPLRPDEAIEVGQGHGGRIRPLRPSEAMEVEIRPLRPWRLKIGPLRPR